MSSGKKAYGTMYDKYKSLRHENKLLKKQCTSKIYSEEDLKKITIFTVEIVTLKNETEVLKNENKSLKSTNSLLEVDIACLTDKVSTLIKNVDDLKFTLTKFVIGKHNLDTILSIKVNFQREGLNYTPPAKVTPQ